MRFNRANQPAFNVLGLYYPLLNAIFILQSPPPYAKKAEIHFSSVFQAKSTLFHAFT